MMKVEKLVALKKGDIIINCNRKKEFLSLNVSAQTVRIKEIETGVIKKLPVSWILKNYN